MQQPMNPNMRQRQMPARAAKPGATGKVAPTGVKIISILYYIGMGIAVLLGVLLIALIFSPMGLLGDTIPGMAGFMTGMLVFMGVLFLAFGVLNFFIARGLWKGQGWSRIIVIIFSALGLLGGIGALAMGDFVQGPTNIVISGLIGGYLLFSSKAKEFFRKA